MSEPTRLGPIKGPRLVSFDWVCEVCTARHSFQVEMKEGTHTKSLSCQNCGSIHGATYSFTFPKEETE